MKKVLYITANSKPEEMSSSKTVGRRLVNTILEKVSGAKLSELDLYKDHIPQLRYEYFEGRNAIINTDARKKLPRKEQKEVKQIISLCDQFVDTDIYVLAAPMWSMSFPSPVKEYFDCVIQGDKTVTFEGKKPHGLLNNKDRIFIYVQASGANIPWLIRPALNKGLNYIHDIVKFMGVNRFEELLVDGTGTTEEERQAAIEKATEKIEDLVATIY